MAPSATLLALLLCGALLVVTANDLPVKVCVKVSEMLLLQLMSICGFVDQTG
jgi:hypothetical protein